jgi:hypothetical protein
VSSLVVAEVVVPGAVALFVYAVALVALLAGRRLVARDAGGRAPRLRVLPGGASGPPGAR